MSDVRERLRYWPWFAALVVVLVTAGILVFDRDDAPQAHAGQVIQGNFVKPFAYTSYVDLPTGRLQIQLTKAKTSVDGDDTMDGREAPDDGSFVGIMTRTTAGRQVPRIGTPTAAKVTIALVVGSRHFVVPADPLSGPTYTEGPDVNRDAWVGVPGTPSDVQIAVTYGSLEQTVTPQTGKRSPGVAAALAALPPYTGAADAKSCAPVRITPKTFTPDRDRTADCHYATTLVPYVNGPGWAKPGHAWLVCTVATDRSVSLRYGKQSYDSVPGQSSDAVTLDGAKSLGDPDSNEATISTGYSEGISVGVFDVATGRHGTVTATVTFRRLATADSRHVPGTPDQPTVTLTWKVPV